MGPIQTIDEFFGLLLRRRLLIAAVTVALTVVTVMFVMSRPRVFQATAAIQVETPTITDSSGAVVPGNSAQRIQTIQQRLTTREALLAMIDRHGLFTDLPITNDEKVHLLRLAVAFIPVASAAQTGFGGPQQVSALFIEARADTAEKAARIANDFAQGVLDASAENQTNRAREAFAFFVEEELRLGGAIDALESEIAAYRNANADSLPELRETRRQEVTDIEAEIRQLDQTLVELANEREKIGKGRALRDSEQQQVAAITAQENVLRAQRADLSGRRDAVTEALTRTPVVEQSLGAMQRRLEQLQAEYDGVTRRKAEADTAQKLEERQQSERFTLLDRAVTPDYPITGGRKKIAIVGAFASLVAGVIAAFALDVLNPVLRTRTQFERDLGLRPVVAIPELTRLRRPRRAPGIPARPEPHPGSGAGQGLWDRLATLAPARFVATLPRPVLGAGAAVVLLVVAMAVA